MKRDERFKTLPLRPISAAAVLMVGGTAGLVIGTVVSWLSGG